MNSTVHGRRSQTVGLCHHLNMFFALLRSYPRPLQQLVPTLSPRPMILRQSSTPAYWSLDAVTKVTREDMHALRDFFNETEPPMPIPIDTTHQRTSSYGTSSLGKSKKKKLRLLESKEKAETDDEKGGPRIRTPLSI